MSDLQVTHKLTNLQTSSNQERNTAKGTHQTCSGLRIVLTPLSPEVVNDTRKKVKSVKEASAS